jgi:uncharacterized membrane protein
VTTTLIDARGAAPAEQRIRQLAEQLLATGIDKLSERESRIITAVAKRTQVSRQVDHAFDRGRNFGGRLADRVASFGGSWTFITIFVAILIGWVAINVVILVGGRAFDPYPFIFLNLILSMLAALQAPVIMMSQNRQAARDRLAAGLDYEINLKAEIEIMELHEKLDQIRDTHLTDLLGKQQEQLQILLRMTQAKSA